ncbi:unnamed protein product, partial [Symbiodinium sp. KB8]
MSVRRSQPILRLLCLAALAFGLQLLGSTFVAPASQRGLRTKAVVTKAEGEAKEQPPASDEEEEKIFDDWFESTDATSGGVFWFWLIPFSAVLFY